MQPFSTGGINPLTWHGNSHDMKRLLIAALLFLAAPVQAARTVYQCTMASARGVETMSIDPEAASAMHQGKPADLHGYDCKTR